MRASVPLLWLESEGEAAQVGRYIDLGACAAVYVGKSGHRRDVGDGYLTGRFHEYDVRRREIAQVAVTASPELTEIVQFGIPDIIVSAGPAPRAAIELTSHKPTYNNLFQRFPKLYRPSERGIPSYIFQLHDPATMVLGKANLVAAAARAEMLNGTPCVVYLYEDHEVDSVHKLISDLIFAHLRNDKRWLREFHAAARSRNEPLIARYDEKSFGGKTFEVHRDHVVANMRVVRNCDSFPEIECGVNHCESAAAQRVTA
ncbi:MAG TPA: hypothetical protein VHS78_00175, partial [Candidatus Elarobacter sp.]|nr:hypothetical protein [Candidatus Elarobacter sp.]